MPSQRRIPDAPAPVSLGTAPRILVIKLASLGDVLLAMPALRTLRRRYPEGRIDLLTVPSSAVLVGESPLVDHTYVFDRDAFATDGWGPQQIEAASKVLAMVGRLRTTRYDAVLLMHHLTLSAAPLKYAGLVRAIAPRFSVGLDNGRGGFLSLRVPDFGFGARHEAEYMLDIAHAVDASFHDDGGDLRLTDLGWPQTEERTIVENQPITIALHPGSGTYSVARRWPARWYAELAKMVHEEYEAQVLVLAGGDDHDSAEDVLSCAGRPDWMRLVTPSIPRELAGVLAACDLFVGNDSFPMHLAVAARVPMVAIFGPSNARAWGPYTPTTPGSAVVVRRDELACSPCFYVGHSLGTPQGCPPRSCLTELTVERVFIAAQRLLGRAPMRAGPGD